MTNISIIVPVYNTGKNLKKCLDSIINQTMQNFEIIIINDGSTDDSEEIINKYLEKNKDKITYISKGNEGVAKARNLGIKLAKSDYILFVDSDDYIDKKLIENVMPYIEKNIDIIKFKIQRVDENGNTLEKVAGPIFNKTSGQDAFDILFSKDLLIDSPCCYILKKELFTKNNLEFNRRYHEDFGLIPIVLLKAQSILSLPNYLYFYVQEKNSITRSDNYNKTIERIKDALFQYDNAIKIIDKMDLRKITKENAKIFYTNAIILKTNELEEKDKKWYIKELKNRKVYKNIISRNFKQLIKKIILRISIKVYLMMR